MNDSNIDKNLRAIQQLTHILAKWESKFYRNRLDNIKLYLSMKIWTYFFKRTDRKISHAVTIDAVLLSRISHFFRKMSFQRWLRFSKSGIIAIWYFYSKCMFMNTHIAKNTNYKDKLKNKINARVGTHFFYTLASRYLTA